MAEIQQVTITQNLSLLNKVDACVLLGKNRIPGDQSGEVMEAIKRGYHILFVGPQPTDFREIKLWRKASEESGITLMFSMWAHYAPTTQWLFNHIAIPRKIHVHREWAGPKYTPDTITLHRIFLEEISICLKWLDKQPVSLDGHFDFTSIQNDKPLDMWQLTLRFANGTFASIVLNPFGLENRHSRFITGDKMAAVCQINNHLIKKWLLNNQPTQIPDVLRFDQFEPAQHLLSHFMRAIKTNEKPAFGIAELYQLSSFLNSNS